MTISTKTQIKELAEQLRPLCPVCQKPMSRGTTNRQKKRGNIKFLFLCQPCGVKQWESGKIEALLDPPAIAAVGVDRTDELIRSAVADNEDAIQDAWLAVLAQGATTEADIIRIAREASTEHRKARNRRMKHELYEDDNKPVEKDGAVGLDRFPAPETDASVYDKVMRCPFCFERETFVKAGFQTDKYGRKRQQYVCKSCWRKTINPYGARWPKALERDPKKVHAVQPKEGEEVDLSVVSRSAIAKIVRCHRGHVSNILLGKQTCSLPLFYDIAKAVGCTMDELFKTISGANGQNPARLKYKRKASWHADDMLPPKYTVEGKGYSNLREALLSLGIERRRPTHYDALPPEIQARITRNRAARGR